MRGPGLQFRDTSCCVHPLTGVPCSRFGPCRGHGEGETFLFEEALRIPKRVEFSAYDHDKSDEVIEGHVQSSNIDYPQA